MKVGMWSLFRAFNEGIAYSVNLLKASITDRRKLECLLKSNLSLILARLGAHLLSGVTQGEISDRG